MLQTGRSKDKERLAKFFKEAEYNEEFFFKILDRFDLLKSFYRLREKFDE